MANMDKHIEELIAAWKLAGTELGIRVVAPFEFKVGAASYGCVAYLPDFGGPKGMLLQATIPPEFTTDQRLASHAREVGYFLSFINANTYSRFDVQEFKDALNDWGFYGPSSFHPEWMNKSSA
jgi:hypothetical protein